MFEMFILLGATLMIVFSSFLVVRAAGMMLMMTGMDENRARFQALSAFTGTGFTSKESEYVVNHPQRRKIISWLMILGNAGFITVIITGSSSILSTSASPNSYVSMIYVIVFLIGLYAIYLIARSQGFTSRWESFIEKRVGKNADFEDSSTENLLHLLEGYWLVRAKIKKKSPFIGKTLQEAKLFREKGIVVLGIERNNKWMPTPLLSERINVDDKLVVYGTLNVLQYLFRGIEPGVSRRGMIQKR